MRTVTAPIERAKTKMQQFEAHHATIQQCIDTLGAINRADLKGDTGRTLVNLVFTLEKLQADTLELAGGMNFG